MTRTKPTKQLKKNKMKSTSPPLNVLTLHIELTKAQFFPDMNELDDLDICPSLKNFEFSSDKVLDLPFLKLQSDVADEEPDDYLLANRTMPGGPLSFPDDGGSDGGFGDEAFGDAFNTATDDFGMTGADDPIMAEVEGDAQGFDKITDLTGGQGKFVMALSGVEGENILSYFDERGGKNWAGPEHWRIQRIKKGMRYSRQVLM